MPLPYQRIQETGDLVRTHQHKVDVILFTSPKQVLLCKDVLDPAIPYVSTPFGGESLYRAMYPAYPLLTGKDAHISVDGISELEVEAVLRDLGLPTSPLYTLQDTAVPHGQEEVVRFHLDLWRQGRVRAVFTYLQGVYAELKAAGAPAFVIYPVDSAVKRALQMVLLEAKALHSREAQIVFGLIQVDRFDAVCRSLRSAYEIEAFKLDLRREMLRLVQPMSGVLGTEMSVDFSVVTTLGVIEQLTSGFRQPVFVRHLAEVFGISVSEGWGAGPVADVAQFNAQSALRFARDEGGGSAFVVLGDSRCIGPLSSEGHVTRLTSTDPAVLGLAAQTGLSARTIERLRFLVRTLGKPELTTDAVARGLNTSERTAMRLLQKLEASGLATVDGQNFVHPRGRPRRVYRVDLG